MRNIILLLGISSSGKSTLSKYLIKKIPEFKLTGFDTIVEKYLPKQYWPGEENEHEGFYYVTSSNGPKLTTGKIGKAFMHRYKAILMEQILSEENIIIDEVVTPDLLYFVDELKDTNVVKVCLKPPLELIQQRELKRGDRKEGLAKSTYDSFYTGVESDILITSDITTDIVDSIIGRLERLDDKAMSYQAKASISWSKTI